MATVTPQGLVTRSLGGYRDRMNELLREAFGADLSLAPETVQGEFAGIAGLLGTEIEEALVSIANGFSVERSVGQQLVDHGILLGAPPLPASHSTATVTFTAESGTTIPAGTRIATTGGDEFATTAIVSGFTGAGTSTVDGAVEAVETGPVEAAAGTLTRIVTRVAGLVAVTNAADAVVGRNAETDAAYRLRLLLTPHRLRRGPLAAFESKLIEAGATHVRIVENATANPETEQGLVIAARSVMCIVNGGDDAAIGAAVAASKSLGVGMSGDTSAGGGTFQRVAETRVKVTVTTALQAGFPSDGVARIKENIIAFAADAFAVGEAITPSRFYTPANRVPGHAVASIAFVDASDQALPATPNLDVLYTLSEADTTVTT